METGGVSELALVQRRSVTGLPQLKTFEKTCGHDSVDFGAEFGDDEGRVVFPRPFLVKGCASKFRGQQKMSRLPCDTCALHQAHPHCIRSSLARI